MVVGKPLCGGANDRVFALEERRVDCGKRGEDGLEGSLTRGKGDLGVGWVLVE